MYVCNDQNDFAAGAASLKRLNVDLASEVVLIKRSCCCCANHNLSNLFDICLT